MDATRHLQEIISNVNDRTQNLAAASEEISASANLIVDTANMVKGQLKDLSEA